MNIWLKIILVLVVSWALGAWVLMIMAALAHVWWVFIPRMGFHTAAVISLVWTVYAGVRGMVLSASGYMPAIRVLDKKE